MAKQRMSRGNSYFPVQIPVYSLSGGIGKQIPSKRLPTECSAMTNFFCTTQSSLDKRNGFRLLSGIDLNSQVDSHQPSSPTLDNIFYYWMEVDAKTSHLFIVDTNWEYYFGDDDPELRSFGGPPRFLQVIKITEKPKEHIGVEYLDASGTIGHSNGGINYWSWKYLTYKDPDNYLPAQKRLEAVTIGSSVLIVNKQVSAGFTTHNGELQIDWTDEDRRWVSTEQLKGFDGLELPAPDPTDDFSDGLTTSADYLGGNIKYLTASAVDPQNKAELWTQYKDYSWGSTAIDTEDPVYEPNAADDGMGEDSYPFEQFRGVTWNDSVTEELNGATLYIDFTSEVLRLDSTSTADPAGRHNRTVLGNQITLKGITSDESDNPGVAQEFNYVWMHRDKNVIKYTGDPHYFTDDGLPGERSAANPNDPRRAQTFVINPINHENATKSTTVLKMPYDYRFPRYPNETFIPDLNGDGEITPLDDYIAAPAGQAGANSTGYVAIDPTDRSRTGANGFRTIGQHWTNGNFSYAVDPNNDPEQLQYVQLEDANGLKCRFYTGFNKNDSASVPWAPYVAYKDGSATEAEIRASGILGPNTGGRMVDFWAGSTGQRYFLASRLAGAINDSDLAMSATYDGHGKVYITQDVAGTIGNTPIVLSKWNAEDDWNPFGYTYEPYLNNHKMSVNDSFNEEDRVFTGGQGEHEAQYTYQQYGSGWADAAELAKCINLKQGASLTAYANQFSVTDDTEFPGRLIVVQKSKGRTTNTKIWYNQYTDHLSEPDLDDDIVYDLATHTATGIIPTAFTGGTIGGTVNNTIGDSGIPTWDGGEGQFNYWEFADEHSQSEKFLVNEITPLRFGVWKVREYIQGDQLPGPTNVMLSDDEDPKGSRKRPHEDPARWERVLTEESDLVDSNNEVLNVLTSMFIPVEDYVYPNPDAPELGQSVVRFSDLTFPPDLTDLEAFNGNKATVATLRWLYDEAGSESDPNLIEDLTHYQANQEAEKRGKGKIIYLSQPYLEFSPGWYRYINKDTAPYLQKIRTPGRRTMLDSRRMPQMIYPTTNESGNTVFGIRQVKWDPRMSGDEETNRGPGIFFDPATGNPKESKIKAMAFYRDRLFLANDDTIVASSSGNWDNFFYENPDNITDKDPLDLMVSSNNYTPIRSLIPFRDFLFVGTDGNTQYELVGSNNIISPKTAEFAPTAFYPMLPDIKPVAMNNNLFFFSDKKLYIYFGQRDLATEQAFEVSKHVEGYLPDDIEGATSSSYGSMIFSLKNEKAANGLSNTSTIYCYRNQVAAEKVVQNAFFDWDVILPTQHDQQTGFDCPKISFIQGSGKTLFAVVAERTDTNSRYIPIQIWYMPLEKDDLNVPRLDKLIDARPSDGGNVVGFINSNASAAFDSATNKTKILISSETQPHTGPAYDTIVTTKGEVLSITPELPGNQTTPYLIEGDWTHTIDSQGTLWIETIKYIGRLFASFVTFSETFVRDEGNNIVPGTLNLRYMVIQAFDSPNFDVEIESRKRSKKRLTYSRTDATDDFTRLDNDAHQDFIGNIGSPTGTYGKPLKVAPAQIRIPILGFSQDVEITVLSNNPHPLNIASLQFNGKFKPITKFHSS